MAFESLSFTHELKIKDFPWEWLPLTYLYDPDLPLFPVLYFHELDPTISPERRPGERDRIFGFIHHINLNEDDLTVSVVCNKDLNKKKNFRFIEVTEQAVRNRLGLGDPVVLEDIKNCLKGPLKDANPFIEELWYKVIQGSFGEQLPFGKMWDPVFGLARYVASFYSSGRKGELIQTHSFCSGFGEHIMMSDVAHADFYLLPTFQELTDSANPLSLFPKFSTLVRAVTEFVDTYCESRKIGGSEFSAFQIKRVKLGNQIKTAVVLAAIGKFKADRQEALIKAYSAFDRGPFRSVFFYQILNDLRRGLWNPNDLNLSLNSSMYPDLVGAYQSPKVIQLYAQQCFGNLTVLPIDNWVHTFIERPLSFKISKPKLGSVIFEHCDVWGKLERLIWIAAQARKVHSSVCSDILWCIRYGAPKDGNKPMTMRGANPFSCKICESHIRETCPGYKNISEADVCFNKVPALIAEDHFLISTSAGNNHTKGQSIEEVQGTGIRDVYSVRDQPEKFLKYPVPGHSGEVLSVREFVETY